MMKCCLQCDLKLFYLKVFPHPTQRGSLIAFTHRRSALDEIQGDALTGAVTALVCGAAAEMTSVGTCPADLHNWMRRDYNEEWEEIKKFACQKMCAQNSRNSSGLLLLTTRKT
jgi:hypothetical protein